MSTVSGLILNNLNISWNIAVSVSEQQKDLISFYVTSPCRRWIKKFIKQRLQILNRLEVMSLARNTMRIFAKVSQRFS